MESNGPTPSDLPDMTSLMPDTIPRGVITATAPPRPGMSLTAAAQRVTSKSIKGGSFKKSTATEWQEDAWEMYDLVGEQRFLASTLAGRMSQARFYVGTMLNNTDDPEPTTDPILVDCLNAIGTTASGRAQLVQRLGVNLFVAGDAWLVGVPKRLMPDYAGSLGEDEEGEFLDLTSIDPFGEDGMPDEDTMADLEWRTLSVSEVKFGVDKVVTLIFGDQSHEKIEVHADDIYLIRMWRPHPRRSWEADSPTRSSLPVLRELVGLTMHIGAQVDSRLAGAGMLIVPQSAVRAMKIMMGLPEDDQTDPFTDALLESMLTPISDRANASALVPLVVTVPDEAHDKFHHITFDKPLDMEAREMRDESIRRLALGQDAPPELLLGVGGMNHWGAWLVREDVVSTHIEPPLALISDALTVQYLHPMMRSLGYSEAVIEATVIWYDVSHMIMRPNRADDAERLYDKGELSGDALREAAGFDESDAPETNDMTVAQATVLEMVKTNPALVVSPGIATLLEQVDALIKGKPIVAPPTAPVPPALQPDAEDGEEESPADETAVPASGPPSKAELPADSPTPPTQNATLEDFARRASTPIPKQPTYAEIQRIVARQKVNA